MTMNKTVIVRNVESSKTKAGSDMYKVKVDDRGKDLYFNVFDAMQGKALAKAAETGEEVVLDLEEDGQWLNMKKIITEIKDAQGTLIPTAQPKKAWTGGGAKADPSKIASIERQSALKQAVEYHSYQPKEVEFKQVLETADAMLEWMTESKKT